MRAPQPDTCHDAFVSSTIKFRLPRRIRSRNLISLLWTSPLVPGRLVSKTGANSSDHCCEVVLPDHVTTDEPFRKVGLNFFLSIFCYALLVMTNLYSMLKPKLHVDIHIEPFHLSTEALFTNHFYLILLEWHLLIIMAIGLSCPLVYPWKLFSSGSFHLCTG